MVHFILLFCLIWIAVDVALWLLDHPGVVLFWTIGGLVIGGLVWSSNQNLPTIPVSPAVTWTLIGALGVFGIWRLIAAALAVLDGTGQKRNR